MRALGLSAPAGFLARETGTCTLLGREELFDRLLSAGLAEPRAWEAALGSDTTNVGRGATGRLLLPGGIRLVLKRMRRGGWTAPLWRDRFASASRLLRNLTMPIEAARRGVRTAAPAALLTNEGPPGLYRAWLASDEIPGAEDLLTRLGGARPPGDAELFEALRTVRRMHDAGVEHRDLNLGNLLLGSTAEGMPVAYVVDLDRARLHDAPLPASKRRASLLRMERSYLKRFGDAGPLADPRRRTWAEAYAGSDASLARALLSRTVLARLSLAIHRLGWKR